MDSDSSPPKSSEKPTDSTQTDIALTGSEKSTHLLVEQQDFLPESLSVGTPGGGGSVTATEQMREALSGHDTALHVELLRQSQDLAEQVYFALMAGDDVSQSMHRLLSDGSSYIQAATGIETGAGFETVREPLSVSVANENSPYPVLTGYAPEASSSIIVTLQASGAVGSEHTALFQVFPDEKGFFLINTQLQKPVAGEFSALADKGQLAVTAFSLDTSGHVLLGEQDLQEFIIDTPLQVVADDAGDTVLDLAFSGLEDQTLLLDLTSLLPEIDSTQLVSITINNVPDGVLLSAGIDNGDGSWLFTPEQLIDLSLVPSENFNGQIPLTVTIDISDTVSGQTTSTTEDVTVNITEVNDSATTADSQVSFSEDVAYIFNLDDFPFSDVDSDSLQKIKISTLPENGQLLFDSNGDGQFDALVSVNTEITATDLGSGRLKFQPDINFNGTPGFDFRVSDGKEWSSNTGTLTLQVNAVNDAASVINTIELSVNEDRSLLLTESQLLSVATDIDGDQLEVRNLSSSSGLLQDNGNGTWTFTTPAHFNGQVDLSYDVFDGAAYTAAEGSIVVNPVNDRPELDSVSIKMDAGNRDIHLNLKVDDIEDDASAEDVAVSKVKVVSDPIFGVLRDVDGQVVDKGDLVAEGQLTYDARYRHVELGVDSMRTGSLGNWGQYLNKNARRYYVPETDKKVYIDSVMEGKGALKYFKGTGGTGTGLGNSDGGGIDYLEKMRFSFRGADVDHAKLTLTGIDSKGFKYWVYDDGKVVKSGTISKSKAVNGAYTLEIDYPKGFDTIKLGNWQKGGGKGFVVRDLDVDFQDSFKYQAVDSEGATSAVKTATIGYSDKIITGAGSDTVVADEAGGTIHGYGGDDVITGSDKVDHLYGDSGNDVLYGEGGADTLVGGAGHDELFGGSGSDNLLGGSGNDLLQGGAGNDSMTGGSGQDTFVIASGDTGGGHGDIHTDTITDFELGKGGDTLDLSELFKDIDNPDPLTQYLTINADNSGNTVVHVFEEKSGNITETEDIVLQGVDYNNSFAGMGQMDIISQMIDDGNLKINTEI